MELKKNSSMLSNSILFLPNSFPLFAMCLLLVLLLILDQERGKESRVGNLANLFGQILANAKTNHSRRTKVTINSFNSVIHFTGEGLFGGGGGGIALFGTGSRLGTIGMGEGESGSVRTNSIKTLKI